MESHSSQALVSVPKAIKVFKKQMHSIEHHHSCLPELRKRAIIQRQDSLISEEIDKGVYSLVDRGFVRPDEDLTMLVQLGSRSSKLPNLRFTKGIQCNIKL